MQQGKDYSLNRSLSYPERQLKGLRTYTHSQKQLKAAAAEAAILLEKLVEKDITIAELQAKIAEYEEYLGRIRLHIQKKEDQE